MQLILVLCLLAGSLAVDRSRLQSIFGASGESQGSLIDIDGKDEFSFDGEMLSGE